MHCNLRAPDAAPVILSWKCKANDAVQQHINATLRQLPQSPVHQHTSAGQANSAFHPYGVDKWVPASAGKTKAGMVHSVSGWTRVCSCEIPWERVPYPSALEVCSWQGAIRINVYLYLTVPDFSKVRPSVT